MSTALVLAPWFVYNAGRFERPVALTNAFGPLLWSSYCDSTYSGPNLGGWGFVCAKGHRSFSSDESVMDGEMRRVGIRYITDHANRLPVVIPVRLLRTFGFGMPRG